MRQLAEMNRSTDEQEECDDTLIDDEIDGALSNYSFFSL